MSRPRDTNAQSVPVCSGGQSVKSRGPGVASAADRGPEVGGILLTGGSSRRMGSDKADLIIGGMTLARRVGLTLEQVAFPVIEVGPGRSGLSFVLEDPPGMGPLAAVVAGWKELERLRYHGPALVLACDLPLLTVDLLRWLARMPGTASIFPVVAGRKQPLCARWSTAEFALAESLMRRGNKSLRLLPQDPQALLAGPEAWSTVVNINAFADVDQPGDLQAPGL